MRRLVLAMAVFTMLAAPGYGAAQTLYNSPGQDTSSRAPLNLRDLLRGGSNREKDKEAVQQTPSSLYTNPGGGMEAVQFEKKLAALNAWRDQRDAQAHIQQEATLQYLAALEEAPDKQAFGFTPAVRPSDSALGRQPFVTPVYRGRNNDAAAPRRLFNSFHDE